MSVAVAAPSSPAAASSSTFAVKDLARVSEFRRRVYLALLDVPKGYVTTYKLLGKAIGCASAQAIGQALRHNPFAPHVPCHRVLDSSMRLHGFGGKSDSEALGRKRRLLESEGLTFMPDGALAPASHDRVVSPKPHVA